MTLLPAVAIAVIVTWALGGAMSRLSALSFRATGAIYAALAAQIVIFSPLAGGHESVVRIGQLASYLLILVFLVANTRIRGMSLIAFGVAANTLAIAANGGLMPVDPGAAQASGWPLELWANGSYHNTVLADRRTRTSRSWETSSRCRRARSRPRSASATCCCSRARSSWSTAPAAPTTVPTAAAPCSPRRCGCRPSGGSWCSSWHRRASAGWRPPRWSRGRIRMSAASPVRRPCCCCAAWPGSRRPGWADGSPTGRARRPSCSRRRWCRRCCWSVRRWRWRPTPRSSHTGCSLSDRSQRASGDTASRAVVVASVDRDDSLLPAANGLLGTARGLAMAGGALGAGLLASVTDATTLVFVAAGAAAVVGVGYAHLRRIVAHVSAEPEQRAEHRQPIPWRMRPVAPLIAMFAIATLATGLVNAALPQVLTNVDGDLAYGIGIGVIGVGLLIGQALGAILPSEQIRGRTIVLALLGMATAVALAGSTLIATTLIVALLLLGLFDGVTETVFDTILQRSAPEHVHGRVFGVAHTGLHGVDDGGFRRRAGVRRLGLRRRSR